MLFTILTIAFGVLFVVSVAINVVLYRRIKAITASLTTDLFEDVAGIMEQFTKGFNLTDKM